MFVHRSAQNGRGLKILMSMCYSIQFCFLQIICSLGMDMFGRCTYLSENELGMDWCENFRVFQISQHLHW